MSDDAELTRNVRDLAVSIAEIAAIMEDRQDAVKADREALRRVERAVTDLHAKIDGIAEPVGDHYRRLRVASETEEANRVKWGNIVTPDRLAAWAKYILPILAAFGVGGGFGANWRGCAGVLVTPADMRDHQEEAPEKADSPQPEAQP